MIFSIGVYMFACLCELYAYVCTNHSNYARIYRKINFQVRLSKGLNINILEKGKSAVSLNRLYPF